MLNTTAFDVLEVLYNPLLLTVYNGSLRVTRKRACWVNSSQKECDESAKKKAESDVAVERAETAWVKLLVRL